MPIYEYECQKCGHEFEALQKVSEGPLKKCPGCGALRLKRLVSAPQFRLKGTGWYETDFKQDKKKRLADAGEPPPAADKAESGDGGAKTDKSDAKEPAAKTKEPEPDKKKVKKKAAGSRPAAD